MGNRKKLPAPLPDKVEGKKCLLEIAEILDQFKPSLNYFLIQGTALGAYRDNGFTPTERDIDLGFFSEEFCYLASAILSAFCFRGFELETVVRPFERTRTIVVFKYGWRADLVSWARWNDSECGEVYFESAPIVPLTKRACGDYCIVHKASLFDNLETVTMFDREWFVPGPIETYLEREYGEDWRTPKEDHESRTRIYDYVNLEEIPSDLLN